MKRHIALVLAILVTVTTLSACAGKSNNIDITNGLPQINSAKDSEYFMSAEPLPLENGEGGSGNGNTWKNNEYFCKQFEELFGHEPNLSTTGPDKIKTLPVYKENYIPGVTAVTNEMKDGFRTQAEDFLNSAGRSDLIEELNPDKESLSNEVYPTFNCHFSDVSVNILPFAVTVMTDIPGLRDSDENTVKDMLKSNNWLAAACELAGIDNPVMISQSTYNYNGDKYLKTIYIHQSSDDAIEAFKNKAFASMFISFTYDSDMVVIGAKRNNIVEYVGDYNLVPYNKALNTLRQERGVKNKDVIGYEIEYTNHISQGYYVPYYKFYFEDTENNELAQAANIEDSGLHVYCEYYVRAVEDISSTDNIVNTTPDGDQNTSDSTLPAEEAASGAGDGNAWKCNEYFCKQLEELFGHEPNLSTTGPDKIKTLPVYKENYIPGVTEITDEMKDGFRTQAEEFLIAAGRSDLIEEGLNPNEEFLADEVNPSFNCEFSDVSLNVLPFAVTVMTDIQGLRNCDEASIKDMLSSNNWLAAACELAGIDDPVVISRNEYTQNGDKDYKTIYVYQNSDDTIEAFKNKAFASMFISTGYDSDTVVIGVKRNNIVEYAGDYNLVPYNKALNTLRQERGVKNKDVIGYEIEYTNQLSKGYYVPYYKFYFEDTENNKLDQNTDLHVYCEYYVRAVED